MPVPVLPSLRGQALEWLGADLTAWNVELVKGHPTAKVGVRYEMQQWQQADAVQGVRGADALAKLPEAERSQWQAFWDEVAALAKRAAEKR